MQHTTHKPSSRSVRYFTHKQGSDGCDSTYDIVSSLTGDVVAKLPYWSLRAETEQEADLLVDALNALVNRGGSICSQSLSKAISATDEVELHEASTVHGSPWTIKQVLNMRPDLTCEEAYGVLHEVACYVTCGFPVDKFDVNSLADATYPIPQAKTVLKRTPFEVHAVVERVLNYLWDDEQRDYEAADDSVDLNMHIFSSLQKVRNWLEEDCSASSDSESREGAAHV